MKHAPLEKTIVAAIVRALKARGVGWLAKTHGGPYQVSGLPDIIAVAPATGRFLGIEVKRPGGRATELQQATLARLNAAGAVAGVAFGVEDALALLNRANSAPVPATTFVGGGFAITKPEGVDGSDGD